MSFSGSARRTLRFVYSRAYGKKYASLPKNLWVYLRPGQATASQIRWRLTLLRRPTELSRYRQTVPLGEIEEFTPCPMCGSELFRRLFRPQRAPGKPGGWSYRVVGCARCGHLWRNPNVRPERLSDLYADSYSEFLTSEYAATRQRRYLLTMKAFEPTLDDGSGRRLLDFGCGTGLFLELAEERGFEVTGTDLSQDSLDLAQRRLRSRDLHFGSPADIPSIQPGTFDVITMWSVLAHLPRPKDDLSTFRRLLADDGMLLIFTVNANSLILKMLGSRWNGFTPNHLMFYSSKTLPMLLRDAGFAAVAFKSFYDDDIEAGVSSVPPSLQQRVRRVIDATDGGNMMRAMAFASLEGARRSGLEYQVL